MSVHSSQTLRTYKVATGPPVTTTHDQLFSNASMSRVSKVTQMPTSPVSKVTQLPVSAVSQVTQMPVSAVSQMPVSAVSQVTQMPVTAVNGSYESMRYLVPVQQAVPQPNYVYMQQPTMMQAAMVQPIMQPMVQQMYLQTLPRVNASTNQQTEIILQQQRTEQPEQIVTELDAQSTHSVFSQASSSIKSEQSVQEEEEVELQADVELKKEDNVETVVVEEVEIINSFQQRPSSARQKFSVSEHKEVFEPTKLDTRYFGELLADVYRKNCDIHSYIFENVSKIRGQKHSRDLSSELKVEKQEVESLLPKGATELTKQQMRYLLQTRFTAEKSMRLLLSTFSSLREELMQMSEDMRRLESEKESLERDLNFKADQARQYDSLIEAVRENNRQLQVSLKEATATQRTLETQLTSSQNHDSVGSFKIKELEGRLRAVEKENEMLKQKLAGQASNGSLHQKTEALAQHYKEQLESLKMERDAEMEKLRSQISRLQSQITTMSTSTTTTTTKSSADSQLQLKISELLARLEQREITIKQKEEEIRRLMMERNDSSKNVTKTIITKRYRNQYPILGLLSDDYQVTSPVKEAKTIVIERTGEMIKQE